MKKTLSILCLLLLVLVKAGHAQNSDETAIRKIMADQASFWNKGDLDNFMKGYWNNDSLIFISPNGPSYGYNAALTRYKKTYGTPDKMGQLTFSDLKLRKLSAEYYFVIGKWFLKRKAGDVGGMYTLLFRKINGQWVIICDHSS